MRKNKTELWSRDFILVIIASTGISFGTYLYLSSLPLYAKSISGSTAWAGLMTGAYSLSALLSRPVAGYLADRYPRRIIALAGAGLCVIACMLYNVTYSIPFLLAFRFIHGFGFGMHSTVISTIAVDIIPSSRRMEGLGHYGIFMTIASAVAPALALPLIQDGAGGLIQITLLAISLMVCTFVALILLKTTNPIMHTNNASTALSSERKNEKRIIRSAVRPSAIVLLVSLIQGGIVSFLALFAQKENMGEIGLFFTCSAIGIVSSRLFAGKIGDRRGPRTILIPALALMTAALLGIYTAVNENVVILLGIPFGLALGCITPTLQTMVINVYPANRRGAANGLVYACIDVGLGIGSMVWGGIADVLDYRYIYLFSAVICSILLFNVIGWKERLSPKNRV